MFDVEIKGVDDALRFAARAPGNAAFALALALNDTAKAVQTFTVNELLPGVFTLRARGAPWWRPGTRMGFNIQFAKKDNLTATLGSQADWLKLQEEGGTKTASGHRVAVPEAARPSPTSVIPRANKPRRMLDQGKAFKVETDGLALILKPGADRNELLYILTPSTQIRPRLKFVETATDMAEDLIDDNYSRRFVEVMGNEIANL
ncbi:MAG: hypothetical protein AB1705_14550 [Verrucomicrobiota bacterium]